MVVGKTEDGDNNLFTLFEVVTTIVDKMHPVDIKNCNFDKVFDKVLIDYFLTPHTLKDLGLFEMYTHYMCATFLTFTKVKRHTPFEPINSRW